MFTCCSALVTAINYAQIPWTFKGLGISWCPSFISLALLNSQRICLPQVVFSSSDLELHHYYRNTTTSREPQGKQSSSSCGAQRIRHDTGYLCNTHNILCDQRAGVGSSGSPVTQHDYLQPARAVIMPVLLWECLQGRQSFSGNAWILLWECLQGRGCQTHTVPPPSRGWQDERNLSATPLA